MRLIGLCTVLAFAGAPLHSSERPAVAHYRLNIPRESLDGALTAFARQTGLQIARFSDVGGADTQVGPVSGNLTSEQALKMLLADSGLTYQELNHETIAVVNQRDAPDANRIGAALTNAPNDNADISGSERNALTDQPSRTNSIQREEVVITGVRRARIALQDKEVTNEEIKQLLAQGYKPVSRNGEVYYCRSEEVLGSHLPRKMCRTYDQIKHLARDSHEWVDAAQLRIRNKLDLPLRPTG